MRSDDPQAPDPGSHRAGERVADTRFRHVDGDQTIVFGDGALEAAADLIGEDFTLLTTTRALAATPVLGERASQVVYVPAGPIPEVAATVLDEISGRALVALGGGRVIDTAKAVAAARGLPGPVAVPTSLSGAEMTAGHRHAAGVDESTPRVRARVVVNDPALSASQPVGRLAASTGNALGHAVTALTSNRSTPIARAVALDAFAQIGRAWSGDAADRGTLALGALLAGWSVDRSGLGPHHALSQSAVRIGRLPHAEVNVALLPHTVSAARTRVPERLADADRAIGMQVEALAARLRARASESGLAGLVSDDRLLSQLVDTASGRPELDRLAPALTRDEIRDVYLAAAG